MTDLEDMAIAGQQLGKHASLALDMNTRRKELWKVVFCVRPMQRLYTEDQ
jgi:hypothetical protein